MIAQRLALIVLMLVLPLSGCLSSKPGPARDTGKDTGRNTRSETHSETHSDCASSLTRPMNAKAAVAPPAGTSRAARLVHLSYVAKVSKLAAGATVKLWIPVPAADPHQRPGPLKVASPLPWRETRAGPNRMIYVEGPAPGAELEVTVELDIRREESFGSRPATKPGMPSAALLIVNGDIRELAMKAKGETPRELGRALFQLVREHMTYDKSGEGWGRGDSAFACDVGKGNCTDFHALFMACCTVRGIPSRFQIGLYGPDRKTTETTKLGGYHCWAEFYADGAWVPVDISEADKHPEQAERHFGRHSPNRITLSTGRDLTLSPPQTGPPLNTFVNPYAEVAGEPHAAVTKRATWRDLD